MVRCMMHATGSKKDLSNHGYYGAVQDVLEHDCVQQLKSFRHHVHTTRFQHSLNVSYYSYAICRRFGWDAVAAARAGLMHDLYFYETCDYDREESLDGTSHYASHPKLALSNAETEFSISEKEADMIVHHMWPVVWEKPHCKEGYVIAVVDKWVAIMEYLAPYLRRRYATQPAEVSE